MLITTTDELRRFCASLTDVPFVTVDTEFMRERTYWSKLCLVQLGGPDQAVAVDPLAPDIDLTPLYDLMANPAILKVFHAVRQDVEIFVNATGRVPAPMFDTQVAAMVCGFGESASYETLAAKLAGAKVDKTSRFTDWAQRPLTDRQVEYALADVTHLRIVYQKLQEKLAASGRADWVQEEMAFLCDLNTYQADPENAWKRLKLRIDKPRLRAMTQGLAAWREREAQRLNVPRGRVMKDETLLEIAHHAPETAADLDRMRGLSHGFGSSRQGTEILEVVKTAQALPVSQCPAGEPRRVMPQGSGAVLDLLRVLLKQVSDEHGVASKLIASGEDLELLATDDNADIKTLTGWRRRLFGEDALALKHGNLSMRIQDHKVVVSKV